MGIKQYSRRNIFGLDAILDSKISKAEIRQTLEDVLNTTSPDAVVGVKAIATLKDNIEKEINEVIKHISSVIDNTASNGNNATWSIDKIKEYVSESRNVVVNNIKERNSLKPTDALVAYVLDTSDDANLGPDYRGKPFAYIYVNGAWQPITPLSKEIDSTVFVKYNDIVNNLTEGGDKKPLSAEMGKKIKEQIIPQAVMSVKQEIVVDALTINNNKLQTSKKINGTIAFNCVEIETDKGIVVVDARVTGPQEVTIYPNNNENFNGLKAKVTYVSFSSDNIKYVESKKESDLGEADGVILNSK